MGKSTIAAQFAHKNKCNYDLVWWFDAGEKITLHPSIIEFIRINGAKDTGTIFEGQEKDVLDMFFKLLREYENWLLIFDNTADFESIKKYISPTLRGNVLVTSQNPAWSQFAKVHKIESLSLSNAVTYFKKVIDDINESDCEELCSILSCIPIALKHSASFISQTGITCKKYISLFESDLKRQSQGAKRIDPKLALTDIWEITLSDIHQKFPEAISIFEFICHFSGAAISPSFIEFGLSFIEKEFKYDNISESKLIDIISLLRKYSLVDQVNGQISVHSLLQQVIIARSQVNTFFYSKLVLLTVDEYFNYRRENPSQWPKYLFLLPHIMCATQNARNNNVNINKTLKVMNDLGMLLGEWGAHNEADKVLRNALHFYENRDSSENLKLETNILYANTLNSLVLSLTYSGRYDEAITLSEKPLKIYKKQGKEDSIEAAKLYNNIALAYLKKGEKTTALEYMSKYSEISSQSESELAPDPKSFVNLGMTYYEIGKLNIAKQYVEKGIKKYKEINDEYNTARSQLHLASILEQMGELSAAKFCINEAIHYMLSISSPFLINDTVIAYKHLLRINIKTDSLDEFSKNLEALEDLCIKFTASHLMETSDLYNFKALFWWKMKNCAKAIENIDSAFRLTSLSEKNSKYLDDSNYIELLLGNRLMIMYDCGSLDTIKDAFKSFIEKRKVIFGEISDEVISAIHYHGLHLEGKKHIKLARVEYQKALELANKRDNIEKSHIDKLKADLKRVSGIRGKVKCMNQKLKPKK